LDIKTLLKKTFIYNLSVNLNMNGNITTAVDSLVKLVKKEGRISLEDASKELGIPQNIINEWASFLEQERIIYIEYKFTTPFLMSRKEEKGKEESADYEMIQRKLDVMRAYLEKSQPKDEKKIKQKEYLLKEIEKSMENTRKKRITREELQKIVRYYAIFKND